MKYTKQQVRNWRAYENVRVHGLSNMMSQEAKHQTGLTEEEYIFVVEHYADLKAIARGSIL